MQQNDTTVETAKDLKMKIIPDSVDAVTVIEILDDASTRFLHFQMWLSR